MYMEFHNPHAMGEISTKNPDTPDFLAPHSASSHVNPPGTSRFPLDTQHKTFVDVLKTYSRGDLPPNVVLSHFFSKNEALDLGNVGRFAMLLAQYTFLGMKC